MTLTEWFGGELPPLLGLPLLRCDVCGRETSEYALTEVWLPAEQGAATVAVCTRCQGGT